MNVYSIGTTNITSSLFDLVEADNSTQLLSYTPTTRIMGIDKSNSDLYYFDGTSWKQISGGTSAVTSGSSPNAVTGLYAETGSTIISLTWNASNLANYYKVYQETSGTETLAGITSATTITVSGLTNGVVYGFRVVATNNFGDSQSSTIVYDSPNINIPDVVSNVSVTNIFTTSATISWTSVSQAISYKVYLTPASGTEVIAATPTTNMTNLTSLVANTQYSIQVAAISLGGEGFLSSAVSFNTLIDYPEITTTTILNSDSRVILNWASASRATTYYILSGSTSASLVQFATTSATTITISGLTNGVNYYYSVISVNSTGQSEQSNIVTGTPEVSTFNIYSVPEVVTSFSGMMKAEQPDDENIPPEGATFSISMPTIKNISTITSAYYDYVDITFANMSTSAATGMVVAIKNNSPWVNAGAAVSAAMTQNTSTGFLSAAVDISAAAPGGITTKTIRFPLTNVNGSDDMAIRFYVPESQALTYARTFTTCGSTSYNKTTIFKSFSLASFSLLNLPLDWQVGIARTSGNKIQDMSASNSANWKYIGSGFGAYKPPDYPSSIPWMCLKWHMKNVPSIRTFELVGDSIAQGYGNNDNTLNVQGITQTININSVSAVGTSSVNWFINFGQSGFTPEQYLARWEEIAKTTSATALIYSIFSPNGYFNGGVPIYSRIEDMKNNCLLAEQKAAQYGRLFIPCFITNTNMFQLNTTPAISATQNTTWIVKELYDWAISTYGNRLLNLQPAVADTTNPIGINMDPQYTYDRTHPNDAGIEALGAKALADIDTVYQNVVNSL